MRKLGMFLGLSATLVLTLAAASQELHHNHGTHHHHQQSQVVEHDATNAVAVHHLAGDNDNPCIQHADSADLEHHVLGDIVHHDGDNTAISDMRAFATGHYGRAQERPETFGAAEHWAHDWELRWVDYDVSDHHVRLYHLTSRHDHAIRFVCAADPDHGHAAEWQPLH